MGAEAVSADELYEQDRVMIEAFTGGLLTREQFDSYSRRFTIATFFGDDQETYRKYLLSPTGLPCHELGEARIALEILKQLSAANVFFPVDMVRKEILEAARIMGEHNLEVQVPAPYLFALREEIRRVRQEGFESCFPAV